MNFDGKLVELNPGQFISGRVALSEESGIHASKVRRLLELFKIDQQLGIESGLKGSMFTVLNWHKWQYFGQQSGQRAANERPLTTMEQWEQLPPPRACEAEFPAANHPSLAAVLAWVTWKINPHRPETDAFSPEEVRRVWLEFEQGRDKDGNWYQFTHRTRLVTHWPSALEDRLLFNRERHNRKSDRAASPIAERIGIEKQIEALTQKIDRIDIPQGPLMEQKRSAALAQRKPLIAEREALKQRLRELSV